MPTGNQGTCESRIKPLPNTIAPVAGSERTCDGKSVMTRARRPYTLSLVLLSTLLLSGNTSQAALIQFVDAPPSGGSGTDYRIDSITDLDIGGTSYDVAFHHGVSFDSLTDPITYSTPASATAALDDVVSFINSEAVDASSATTVTDFLFVPYDLTAQFVGEFNASVSPLGYFDFDLGGSMPSNVPIVPDTAFLTFAVSTSAATYAMPEPSTFFLGVMAVLACSGCRRLRRRRERTLRA